MRSCARFSASSARWASISSACSAVTLSRPGNPGGNPGPDQDSGPDAHPDEGSHANFGAHSHLRPRANGHVEADGHTHAPAQAHIDPGPGAYLHSQADRCPSDRYSDPHQPGRGQ